MRRFAFATLIAIAFVSQARASGGEHEASHPNLYSKKPATRYSGDTPIDLKNGLLLNNGTYGQANPDYESWATAPTVVAGLSEQAYSYRQKGEFVRTLKEQVAWVEAAITNWKNTTSITRPEAIEYSKNAVTTLSPILENLKSATSKADGAGEKEWASAESNARKVLIDMRTAYTQMHHNTQWHSRHAQAAPAAAVPAAAPAEAAPAEKPAHTEEAHH